MAGLGPLEIGLILLAIMLLFGYKKLPSAARDAARSVSVFKNELRQGERKTDDA